MKKTRSIDKRIVGTILFMTLLVTSIVTINASQYTIDLGKTTSFAILAGETITNTGPTTVNGTAGGNIGLFPGTSFTGQSSVTLTGVVNLANTLASEAKDALTSAYNDALGRTPVTTIPQELGTTTLTPGVYASIDGSFLLTGTLILDGQNDPDAIFIFKTASTITTASNSNVSLINGAQDCHVFWQVGSSATLGTNSNFVGHILASSSITAETGAKIRGQLLALNGAVTLDSSTITNNLCATGAKLPNTSLEVNNWLYIGIVFTLIGVSGFALKKYYQ